MVGQVTRGDKVYVAAQVANCEWLDVAVPGVDGPVWVTGGSQYVAMNVPCDSLLAVDTCIRPPCPRSPQRALTRRGRPQAPSQVRVKQRPGRATDQERHR